ncbi:MAG: aromatic ring-hydroxylating dioxygenase subunit alpha [Phycisphaerales bacterium]|nr:aromatic ring-hydroxylating dioxygenase subunit alpha [Phycisphaerae bacterium]NNF42639.1 aromatic ring-hydroxylating dioxygenase subunit alpha [Phycisphaerales bacterium]NNM26726.1 aromatic ring-hydroxylating dioxygenase subunit alpha [Phycisphaerales bacterium]
MTTTPPGPRLDVDADIRRAATLPGWFYRDDAVFAWARDRIFARSWQLVEQADTVTVPQQVLPFDFLPGLVEEPLLLVRDAADVVRCLSNVCTHRGMPVVAAPGRCAHLRCPYHGRRFGLDGCFEHMPEFEDAEGFPRPADDLTRLPLESWGPFSFTALDPRWSFDDFITPVRTRMQWLADAAFRFDATRSRDYLVQANWALYCDNFLEGFHIPFVHSGLNEVIDYGSYRTELAAWGNVQIGVTRGAENAFVLPPGSPDAGSEIGGYYFWLFPNLMLNFYPWGISVNIVKPLAVDRTRVSYLTFVADPSQLDQGAGAALDRVEREDEAIVEAVHRGLASRHYDRGRYSPKRETGVHHFHRLLAELWNSDHA